MTTTPTDEQVKRMHEAMQACIDHSRDLLECAQAVQASGKPHIAYHLATLALEELGRRELIAVESIASQQPVPPAWPMKHTQDHVKKLFWAFFGANFTSSELTKDALENMEGLAQLIHANRLSGLYVDANEDGLHLPRDAISSEDSGRLINVVNARLALAASQIPRTDITEEEREDQRWFLSATEDPERRQQILSPASLTKLAQLKTAKDWVKWLRGLFDEAAAQAHLVFQEEIQRSKNLPTTKTKYKWKLRIRIFSDSHSIRPKALTAWNSKSDWLKLEAVSGKKNQILVSFFFGDNVPVEALWFFGWSVARLFVTALNIGSMGFWWWRLPEQISRYYESLEDLDRKMSFVLDRNPSLKIDWGENRVLTEEDLVRVALCMATLPGPGQRDKHAPLDYYIGGVTFLSLNDIHWQCEIQAYGNFHECLKAMMKEAGVWNGIAAFEAPFLAFIQKFWPVMEPEERDRFIELCRRFEEKNLAGVAVTLKEVSFIKLFCDAYFLNTIQSPPLEALFDKSRDQKS